MDLGSLAEIIKSEIRCDNWLYERRQERRDRDTRLCPPTQVPTSPTTFMDHTEIATPM